MSEHEGDAGEVIRLDAEIDALLADPSLWGAPSDGLDDRIAAAVQAEVADGVVSVGGPRDRARGRMQSALLGAVAAMVFVIVGVVGLSALNGVDERATFASPLTSTGLVADVSGEIEITSFDSGLRIDLAAPGLPRRDDGAFYEGWLRTVDGDLIPVGTFHDGDDVTMWAGVAFDRVEAFTITLENAVAGDDIGQASSGEVVLRAAIGG